MQTTTLLRDGGMCEFKCQCIIKQTTMHCHKTGCGLCLVPVFRFFLLCFHVVFFVFQAFDMISHASDSYPRTRLRYVLSIFTIALYSCIASHYISQVVNSTDGYPQTRLSYYISQKRLVLGNCSAHSSNIGASI
jgi:hypothetical protein